MNHTETYANGAIMGLTFIAGFSVANLVVAVIASVAIGLLSKGVDSLIKLSIATLSDTWRRRALAAEARVADAEQQLRALRGQKDAT